VADKPNYDRPFDVLEEMSGEGVTVTLKDGTKVVGTLHAFDKHINMALKNVEVHPAKKQGKYTLEKYFQRGDSVRSVEPEGGNGE